MRKTRVYLCDLIHNHFSSREDWGYAVPLNIGYIGAYLQHFLNGSADISYYKYPDELVAELKRDLPDIIGLSCYCWNQELVLHIAKKVKALNPNVLVVLGGSNIGAESGYLESVAGS